MGMDIIERLQIDPGKRTLGELIQDREAALHEIRRLQGNIERLRVDRDHKQRAAEISSHLADKHPSNAPMLLALRELCELLSISRSSIYKWLSEGDFPQPIRIGGRSIRWRVEDIEAWKDSLA